MKLNSRPELLSNEWLGDRPAATGRHGSRRFKKTPRADCRLWARSVALPVQAPVRLWNAFQALLTSLLAAREPLPHQFESFASDLRGVACREALDDSPISRSIIDVLACRVVEVE